MSMVHMLSPTAAPASAEQISHVVSVLASVLPLRRRLWKMALTASFGLVDSQSTAVPTAPA